MIIVSFLILVVAFIIWSYLIKMNKLLEDDESFYNSLSFNDFKITFFRIFTNLASTKFFVIACLLLFIFLENKTLALVISVLMIINALVVFIFKHIFKRERPNKKRLVIEKGYSYPSGHTVSSISFYGFILLYLLFNITSLPLRILLFIIITTLIYGIGYSRVFLGVHYFSDIVGGVLVGSAYLLVYAYVVFNILALV